MKPGRALFKHVVVVQVVVQEVEIVVRVVVKILKVAAAITVEIVDLTLSSEAGITQIAVPLNTVCWLDTLPAQLAKALNIISCSFLTPLPVRALWQESVEPPAPHLKMPSGGVFAASRKHLVLTRARTRENRCNHGDACNIILIRSGNLS